MSKRTHLAIANPIYDVVFKYLMDDNEVAKTLLSSILNMEISELELSSQEIPLSLNKLAPQIHTPSLIVMRMDFKATVTYQDGTKNVILIELQKVKLPSDLFRFRKYLRSQYSNENNLTKETSQSNVLPIFTIYLLGYKLKNLKQYPIVRIKRNYIDVFSDSIIDAKDTFIESLTHDCITIQIPLLKKSNRTELEQLLSIFETNTDHSHTINIDLVPKKYHKILLRLNKALLNDTIQKTMDAEDELLSDLQFQEKLIESQNEEISLIKATIEKEKANAEREKANAEREKANAEKEKAEKVKATQLLKNSILQLIACNVELEKISLSLNISLQEINEIIK